MKVKIVALLGFSLLAASLTFAQTKSGQQGSDEQAVQGGGTVNYIAKFTGSHKIGNSALFENGPNLITYGNVSAANVTGTVNGPSSIAVTAVNDTPDGSVIGVLAQTRSPASVAIEAQSLATTGDPGCSTPTSRSDRTDISGQPLRLELLEKIGGIPSERERYVRLRVSRPVRVGDLLVIEEGAEAVGRATIVAPSPHVAGRMTLEAVSAIGITGEQIPLFGSESSTGTGCVSDDYLPCFWEDGGPASMDLGLEFEASIAQGATLPTETLLAHHDTERQNIQRAIASCAVRLALWVYQPKESKLENSKILLDGVELGRIPPGSMRSLVPKAGLHVISVKQTSLTVNFQECTPYYIRLFQGDRGKHAKVEIQNVRPDIGREAVRDLWEMRAAEQ